MRPARGMIQLRPEGLYCAAGDFHIDPWLPVPRAVITHGHGDHARVGMGEYHCTAGTAPILRWRLGEQRIVEHAYGHAFNMNGARVSLHSAGHVLGSAQVRVEVDGDVWVASGDYKRQSDPTCEAFDVVPCDVFITEATFALPVYRWPDTHEAVAQIVQWRRSCEARKEAAVLYCYALGKAQRVLAELLAFDEPPPLLHGAIAAGVEVYRACGVAMAATELVSEQGSRADHAGRLVIAPPSAAGSPWLRRFRHAQQGFASGWMRIRGNRRRRNFDRGFMISDHADWPDLLRTIEQTGARRVFATHGTTDALVRTLSERGIDARALRTSFGEDA